MSWASQRAHHLPTQSQNACVTVGLPYRVWRDGQLSHRRRSWEGVTQTLPHLVSSFHWLGGDHHSDFIPVSSCFSFLPLKCAMPPFPQISTGITRDCADFGVQDVSLHPSSTHDGKPPLRRGGQTTACRANPGWGQFCELRSIFTFLNNRRSKRIPEKHLLLLHWLH